MRNFFLLSSLALTLGACAGNPCDEYVEYLCECSSKDDCDDYKNTYEDADQDAQAECDAALDDAKEEAESCDDSGSGA